MGIRSGETGEPEGADGRTRLGSGRAAQSVSEPVFGSRVEVRASFRPAFVRFGFVPFGENYAAGNPKGLVERAREANPSGRTDRTNAANGIRGRTPGGDFGHRHSADGAAERD